MKTLGTFEAKTKFSALIEEVQHGQTIVVTRNGKPVAQIGPVAEQAREEVAQAVERIRALRKRLKLGNVNIRNLIEEGRK